MHNRRRLLSTGLALAVVLAPGAVAVTSGHVTAGVGASTAADGALTGDVDTTAVDTTALDSSALHGAAATAGTGYTVVRQTTCRVLNGTRRCSTRFVRRWTTTATTTPTASSTTSTAYAFLSKDSAGRPAH